MLLEKRYYQKMQSLTLQLDVPSVNKLNEYLYMIYRNHAEEKLQQLPAFIAYHCEDPVSFFEILQFFIGNITKSKSQKCMLICKNVLP